MQGMSNNARVTLIVVQVSRATEWPTGRGRLELSPQHCTPTRDQSLKAICFRLCFPVDQAFASFLALPPLCPNTMTSPNPEEIFVFPIEMRTVDLLSHRTMDFASFLVLQDLFPNTMTSPDPERNFLLSNRNEDYGSAEPPYDGIGIIPPTEEESKRQTQNTNKRQTQSQLSDAVYARLIHK
jgi:hypothetical protein